MAHEGEVWVFENGGVELELGSGEGVDCVLAIPHLLTLFSLFCFERGRQDERGFAVQWGDLEIFNLKR